MVFVLKIVQIQNGRRNLGLYIIFAPIKKNIKYFAQILQSEVRLCFRLTFLLCNAFVVSNICSLTSHLRSHIGFRLHYKRQRTINGYLKKKKTIFIYTVIIKYLKHPILNIIQHIDKKNFNNYKIYACF